MSKPQATMQDHSAVYSVASPVALRNLRRAAGTIVVVPLLLTGVALYLAVVDGLSLTNIVLFALMYTLTLLGITVGFHRYFAHRSFETSSRFRWVLGVLGSMAGQGPLLWWVATHRRHHQYSDSEFDPHSPNLSDQPGWRGVLKGFCYGHIGWMFSERISSPKFAANLLSDKIALRLNRGYFMFLWLGLLLPALIGGLIEGTWYGAFTGFLWGGMVRLCLVDHALWLVGSLSHMAGARPYAALTKDRSANNWTVALLAFGEGLQNNHHAFPNAAIHGFRWWEPDFSGTVIRALRWLGWITKVRVANPALRHQALQEQRGISAVPAPIE